MAVAEVAAEAGVVVVGLSPGASGLLFAGWAGMVRGTELNVGADEDGENDTWSRSRSRFWFWSWS